MVQGWQKNIIGAVRWPIGLYCIKPAKLRYQLNTSEFKEASPLELKETSHNINVNQYFISSSGDRTRNQWILQPHFVPHTAFSLASFDDLYENFQKNRLERDTDCEK